MVFEKNAGFFDKSQIYGGAINVCDDPSVVFESGAEFEDNLAKGGGGAVDVYGSRSEVVFDGDVFLKDNLAKVGGLAKYIEGLEVFYGGHVFAERRGVVKFSLSSSSYFKNGEADFGGAIAGLTRGEVIMDGKAEFKNNVARECGGTIATDRGSFKDRSNKVKFKNNEENDDKSDAGD